jgi:hypothetical protein
MPLAKEVGLLGMKVAIIAIFAILPHRLLFCLMLPPPAVVTTVPVDTLAVGIACCMVTC